MAQRNPSRPSYLSDGQWFPRRLTMLRSPAWKAAPVPLRRLLERLEIEHLMHGGAANGELRVSYGQFALAGVSRRQIKALLDLGTTLGFVEVRRPEDLWDGVIRPENTYRLTYVPEKGHRAPTDEWEGISGEAARKAVDDYRNDERDSRGSIEAEELEVNAA